MSLGIFGLILVVLLIVMGIDPKTRGRIVFTALVAMMLGLTTRLRGLLVTTTLTAFGTSYHWPDR